MSHSLYGKCPNPGQFPNCSWKVSNPGSLAPKLQEDWMGTQSIGQLLFIRFTPEFLYLVPQGDILVTAPKLQEDWLGTKDEIGSSNVHLDSSNLHLDLVPQELILVTAPKLKEEGIGTRGISQL